MILSILIATTEDRHEMFMELMMEFQKQIRLLNATDKIEIIPFEDNKEISIGAKRQKLLEQATGDWIVFFDSDDKPYEWYCKRILDAIEGHPDIDCIGMSIFMTTDGKRPQNCCHSLMYPEWKEKVDNWDFVRNITHFNPVKRHLALQTGFKDLRFGEDKDYSDRLFPLLTKEHFIADPMFHYRYTTHMQHNKKYGIKN